MPSISKNSVTCRIRICDLLQSRDFESHALPHQPRKLNSRQTLVKIYQLNKLINYQCHSAKNAPNTNRLNFAGNNLEYRKLKASTLNLHAKKLQSIKAHHA